jgi:hypothetical protein
MSSSSDQPSGIAADHKHRVRLNMRLVAVAVAVSMAHTLEGSGAQSSRRVGETMPIVEENTRAHQE